MSRVAYGRACRYLECFVCLAFGGHMTAAASMERKTYINRGTGKVDAHGLYDRRTVEA